MTEQNTKIDYVRFGSWDDKTALELFALLRREMTGEFRQAKWLQYKGWRSKDMFYGVGEQNKRRHYIVEQSGPNSSYLAEIAKGNQHLYCTRIDLQITIPMPQEYNPFRAYAEQQELSNRKCSIIHSETGSTIYFGSREGETFARLYVKKYDLDEFLRLEWEIKGKAALAIWLQINEGTQLDDIYNHYLKKIKMPEYIKEWYRQPEGSDIFLQISRIHTADKQLEWLQSLENTVIKMANDHYQGKTTRALIERWLKLIDKSELQL